MVNQPQPPKYLSPREVAAELCVGESTVLQWLRESKLPGYRFGYRWKVKRIELDAWKQTRRNHKTI